MRNTKVYVGVLLLCFAGSFMCSCSGGNMESETYVESQTETHSAKEDEIEAFSTETAEDQETTAETEKITIAEESESETEETETLETSKITKETETMEETTMWADEPISIKVNVTSGHCIGDHLTAADFTVEVTMGDGSVITNPDGWTASTLQLNTDQTQITVTYKGISETVTVKAAERPMETTVAADNSNTTASSAGTSQTIDGTTICMDALQYAGLEYVYGGESLTTGADCSGFTYAIYKQYGITLPRTAAQQATVGVEVSLEDALPGDLVVEVYEPGGMYTGHAGIYLGSGHTLSCMPGCGVVMGGITGYTFLRIFNNTADPDGVMLEWMKTGNVYWTEGMVIDGVPYVYTCTLFREYITVDLRDSNLKNGVYTCTAASDRKTVLKEFVDKLKVSLEQDNYKHTEFRNGEQIYWLSDGTEFTWQDVENGTITSAQLEQGYDCYQYEKFW